MKYYVYIYFDPSRDNEPIYVGKGNGRRCYSHLKRTDNNLFPNRLNKMKENGVQPIIKKIHFETEELALDVERYLISQLGRIKLNNGPLLNLTDGGEGCSGYEWTKEQKIHLSKVITIAATGRAMDEATKLKMSIAKLGKSKSEATKLLMSEAKLNKPLVICPHCGKEGKLINLKPYHFDNCKLTPNLLTF